MIPPSRRSVTPHGATQRAEPELSPNTSRSAPRLVAIDPPPGARPAAASPRLELTADERPLLSSVDSASPAMLGKSLVLKVGLAVMAVLALIGAGSLAQRFLGL